MNRLAFPLFLAATAALSPAQTLAAFPSELQNQTGGSYETYFPFGNGISRTMAVLESWALNIPNGRQIDQIRLRQNEGSPSPARMIQVAVYMGGTDKTALTASSTFTDNYTNGTPRTLVYGPAIFNLPALSATQAPWQEVVLPLTTPYTYNANENLVLEFVITANNNANNSFAYYVDAGYFTSAVATFGQGCLTSANQVPALTGTGGYYGGSVSFALSQAPSNSTLYFNLNVAPTTPIAGAPFGAPGCTLLVGALAGYLGTAPGGSYYQTVQIPNHPSFYGLRIYGQAMIFDLFANPLGFAASNGATIDVGALPPMAKITAGGSATATTGGVTRQSGPIFVFRHN